MYCYTYKPNPFQRDMLYNVSSSIGSEGSIDVNSSIVNSIGSNNNSSISDSGEEGESFLGLGWGQVEWAVCLLGIGTTVAAISWMVR